MNEAVDRYWSTCWLLVSDSRWELRPRDLCWVHGWWTSAPYESLFQECWLPLGHPFEAGRFRVWM